MNTLPQNISLKQLETQLQEAGISFEFWGKSGYKSIKDLHREIQQGESILSVDESGNITRQVSGVRAFIYYTSEEGEQFILQEEKQIFSDGTEKKRPFHSSLGEKSIRGESLEETLLRGIKEELGISSLLTFEQEKTETLQHESRSYPGLFSVFYNTIFSVHLTKEQFSPEGYVEEEKNVTTYFVWKETNFSE